MILRDVIDVSLDNLRQSRLRTALTVLGVTIGVGAIVGMLGIAVGLQDNLYDQILRLGFFRRITVLPRMGQDQQAQRPLDESAMLAIRQIPGVKGVDRAVRLPAKLEIGDKPLLTNIAGVPMDDADEAVFADIKYGHFFSNESGRDIILNSQAAASLGYKDPRLIVGQTVHVTITAGAGARGFGGFPVEIPSPAPFDLRVAGVIEKERALFGDIGPRVVYIPQKLIEEKVAFFTKEAPVVAAMAIGFAPLVVRLNDARDVDRVEKQIRGLSFRTVSIASVISNMRRAFLAVDLLLALIGSMALTVASLGIINTMVMAVLERTREIGVMKAVGAEDGDIRHIFLTESAIIGIAGGLAGVLMAWCVGRLINFGANRYIISQGFRAETLFHIPLWLVGAAMGFALFVSVVSGLYPADRAARIDPARALRHD